MIRLAAAVAMLLATAANAQNAPASQTQIPAQPLIQALNAFATQTGLQIMYVSNIAEGRQSKGAPAGLTPEQALARLLEGTDLTYEFLNDRTVAIRSRNDSSISFSTSGDQGLHETSSDASTGRMRPDEADAFKVAQAEAQSASPGADSSTDSRGLAASKPEVDEVVVTGRYVGSQVARGGRVGLLGDRDMLDTPFNISYFTSELIENQQAATIADIVANDPSIRRNFARGATSDEITVRGFTVYNRDVAFNGMYGLLPAESVPVEIADRVEVLKGPGALLNGMAPSGSVGGSINVASKKAGEQPLTRLTVTGASDSQFGAHLDVGRRFGEESRSGLRFNGVYRSGDTPLDHNSDQLNFQTLSYDFRGERTRLDATISYWSRSVDASQVLLFPGAVVTPAIDAPDSHTNFFQPWTFTDGRNLFGTVRFEADLAENLTAFVGLGASGYDTESLQTNWTVQDAAGLIRSTPFYQKSYNDVRTGDAGLRSRIITGPVTHSLVASFTGYRSEDGIASSSIAPPIFSNVYDPVILPKPALPQFGSPPRSAESRLRSIALADALSAMGDRLQLMLGVRRQEVETTGYNTTTGLATSHYDEHKTTPMAAVVVKPRENVALYANYIEGLSQGPIAPSTALNAGQAFPPYTSKQHELGIKVDWGSFATTLSGFQIRQPSGLIDPVTQLFGIDGEQRNRGIEVNTFGQLTQNLRLLGGLMLLDAEMVRTANGTNDGHTALGAPDVQVNIGAEWDVPQIPRLTLSARVLYTDSQFANLTNTVEIPSWTRFDAGARYAFEAGRVPVALRLNIENLFDKGYWASAGRGRLLQGAPRIVLVSVTTDF